MPKSFCHLRIQSDTDVTSTGKKQTCRRRKAPHEVLGLLKKVLFQNPGRARNHVSILPAGPLEVIPLQPVEIRHLLLCVLQHILQNLFMPHVSEAISHPVDDNIYWLVAMEQRLMKSVPTSRHPSSDQMLLSWQDHVSKRQIAILASYRCSEWHVTCAGKHKCASRLLRAFNVTCACKHGCASKLPRASFIRHVSAKPYPVFAGSAQMQRNQHHRLVTYVSRSMHQLHHPGLLC